MVDFFGEHAGLWAFLAVPLALWAAAAASVQVILAVKVGLADDRETYERLRERVRSRRVTGDLRQHLILSTLSPIRLVQWGGVSTESVADLYARVRDGRGSLVLGPAGAGKSTLGLALAAESVTATGGDEPAPLIDVVQVRRWRRPLFHHDWRAAHRWIAAELHRSHPGFGRRYFRRLLAHQRLVPCLDGLDEASATQRRSLSACLRSMGEVGFPTILLGRDVDDDRFGRTLSAGVSRDEFDGAGVASETLVLVPLDRDFVLGQLSSRPGWSELIPRSRDRPDLSRALGNPLMLSVATLTWGPHDRPTALLDGRDAERDIWEAFLADRLEARSVDSSRNRLLRTAESAALVSAQTGRETFGPSSLWVHPLGAYGVSALLALAVLGAFAVDPDQPIRAGMWFLLWFAFHCALVPVGRDLLAPITRLAPWLPRGALTTGGVVVCFMLVTALAFETGKTFFSAVPDTVTYWDHVQRNDRYVLLGCSWAGLTGYLLRTPSVPALATFGGDIPASLGRLGGLDPRLLRIVGFGLVGAGIAFGSPWLALVGLWLSIACAVAVMSALVIAVQEGLGALRVRTACKALARAGILSEMEGRYRFRHESLVEALARRRIEQLAAADQLGRVPAPWMLAVSDVVDARVDPAAMAFAGKVTRSLEARWPRLSQVIISRYLYLAFGEANARAAEVTAERFLSADRRGKLRALRAESLEMQGRHDAAESLWDAVLVAHGRSDWVLHRWVRHEIQSGSHRRAVRVLGEEIARRGASGTERLRLLRAEIESVFGDPPAQMRAHLALERLRATAPADVAIEAAVESARVEVEQKGDAIAGEQILETLLSGSSGMHSLVYARYAQLESRHGCEVRARALASEALRLASWEWDPTDQLEVAVTAILVGAADTSFAADRARQLVDCRWSLWYRDALCELSHGNKGAHCEILRAAFAPPSETR